MAVSGRSIVDPVTRIEGHLRIECQVDNGVVTDAWASGTLFRGMEQIMQGRTPADAFYVTQRICGVCPISHGHTSSMAAEKALGITVPNNARIIRNILEGAQFLHSHILWFYNLAGLDWVNPVNALKANIADTYSLAEQAKTGTANFKVVQDQIKKLVDGGQLSIFSGNWFDQPEYNLPPELDLIATAHYLEALQMQAEASTISGIIGGKMPHVMTSLPGGTTWVPSEQNLDDVLFRLLRIKDWIAGVMIPDTLAIAPFYLDALKWGGGVGEFLAWGVFNREGNDPNKRYLPAGVVTKGFKLEDADETKAVEYVNASFYEQYEGGLNPAEGKTQPAFPEGGYDLNGEYSWVKGPRYGDKPLEVGGLARLLVAYLRGVPEIKALIDGTLAALGAPGKPEVLVSTLGRTASRNLEALYVAEQMVTWVNELIASLKGGDSSFFAEPTTDTGSGFGLWEAPRGALLHYEDVKGGKIARYQAIVPSTWNASPIDPKGVKGPMEQSLIGVPVSNLEKPLDILRTVHSFDPCIACAVHVTDVKDGKTKGTVWTNPIGGVR